jgi:CBS domain containing-hemolysin-like protein
MWLSNKSCDPNDIVALDSLMSEEEMIAAVKETGYSRLPVFEEQLDNIKGILYVKDLIAYLDKEHQPKIGRAHRPGSVVCAGSQEDQ